MKIVYMGTPDFAVKPLEALLNNNYDVVGVFTQPDKPVGRKAILTPPPVKVVAIENNIPVFQPESLKNGEGVKILETLKPPAVEPEHPPINIKIKAILVGNTYKLLNKNPHIEAVLHIMVFL